MCKLIQLLIYNRHKLMIKHTFNNKITNAIDQRKQINDKKKFNLKFKLQSQKSDET